MIDVKEEIPLPISIVLECYDETIVLDDKYDNEKVVYIILETTGECVNGDFEFEYN